MKKILISIAFSLICILSFCQERIDTNTYLQFNKTTRTLKKVVGYSNITGKWERQKNQVYYGLIDDTQKFNILTVKSLIYNDTLYYVLIKNYTGSASTDRIVKSGDTYKYRSGGGSVNGDLLYFFIAAEFEQIFHLDEKAKTIYSFKKHLETYSRYKKPTLPNISEYVLKSANKNQENDFMQIRISDDGKMVRFLLPYQRKEIKKKNIDLFSNNYFEMPLKDFYKWLKPVSPLNE